MIDTQYNIETPEGIELILRPAGPVVRSLAFLVDLGIRAVLIIAASIAMSFAGNFGTGVMLIVFFTLEWFYPVLFEVFWNGKTPGKMMLGIRVVSDNGTPVSWGASLVRNLLRTVDFLPFIYLGAFISMVVNQNFRRIGDLTAKTIVIYEQHQLKKPGIPQAIPVPLPFPLRPEDQKAIINFSERCDSFSKSRADELASKLSPLFPHQTEDPVLEIHKYANGLLRHK